MYTHDQMLEILKVGDELAAWHKSCLAFDNAVLALAVAKDENEDGNVVGAVVAATAQWNKRFITNNQVYYITERIHNQPDDKKSALLNEEDILVRLGNILTPILGEEFITLHQVLLRDLRKVIDDYKELSERLGFVMSLPRDPPRNGQSDTPGDRVCVTQ